MPRSAKYRIGSITLGLCSDHDPMQNDQDVDATLAERRPLQGRGNHRAHGRVVGTLRSLLPALERMTGLDPNEVGIETLADRLREDAVAHRRVQVLPITIGAWA